MPFYSTLNETYDATFISAVIFSDNATIKYAFCFPYYAALDDSVDATLSATYIHSYMSAYCSAYL